MVLREPAVKKLCARAVVSLLLRFYSHRHGVKLMIHVLPDAFGGAPWQFGALPLRTNVPARLFSVYILCGYL